MFLTPQDQSVPVYMFNAHKPSGVIDQFFKTVVDFNAQKGPLDVLPLKQAWDLFKQNQSNVQAQLVASEEDWIEGLKKGWLDSMSVAWVQALMAPASQSLKETGPREALAPFWSLWNECKQDILQCSWSNMGKANLWEEMWRLERGVRQWQWFQYVQDHVEQIRSEDPTRTSESFQALESIRIVRDFLGFGLTKGSAFQIREGLIGLCLWSDLSDWEVEHWIQVGLQRHPECASDWIEFQQHWIDEWKKDVQSIRGHETFQDKNWVLIEMDKQLLAQRVQVVLMQALQDHPNLFHQPTPINPYQVDHEKWSHEKEKILSFVFAKDIEPWKTKTTPWSAEDWRWVWSRLKQINGEELESWLEAPGLWEAIKQNLKHTSSKNPVSPQAIENMDSSIASSTLTLQQWVQQQAMKTKASRSLPVISMGNNDWCIDFSALPLAFTEKALEKKMMFKGLRLGEALLKHANPVKCWEEWRSRPDVSIHQCVGEVLNNFKALNTLKIQGPVGLRSYFPEDPDMQEAIRTVVLEEGPEQWHHWWMNPDNLEWLSPSEGPGDRWVRWGWWLQKHPINMFVFHHMESDHPSDYHKMGVSVLKRWFEKMIQESPNLSTKNAQLGMKIAFKQFGQYFPLEMWIAAWTECPEILSAVFKKQEGCPANPLDHPFMHLFFTPDLDWADGGVVSRWQTKHRLHQVPLEQFQDLMEVLIRHGWGWETLPFPLDSLIEEIKEKSREYEDDPEASPLLGWLKTQSQALSLQQSWETSDLDPQSARSSRPRL